MTGPMAPRNDEENPAMLRAKVRHMQSTENRLLMQQHEVFDLLRELTAVNEALLRMRDRVRKDAMLERSIQANDIDAQLTWVKGMAGRIRLYSDHLLFEGKSLRTELIAARRRLAAVTKQPPQTRP